MTRRWYEFRAQASSAEIVIYDEIGAFGIPAKAFIDELKALGPIAELTLRINSPGGSVFDGVAIYNALERQDARITVWIDGIAASVASMIAMAGDEIVMPENAMLVLHDPSGVVMGTASEMRATADALDKMKAGMVAAYREKSGRDDAEVEALMQAETWLSAEEAVELGLADRVEKPVRMAAHFDLSAFRNTPPQLAAMSASTSHQEDDMADPKNKRSGRSTPAAQVEQDQVQPAAEAVTRTEEDQGEGSAAQSADAGQPCAPDATPQRTPTAPAQAATEPASQPATPGDAEFERAPQPIAQVIDLDAVRTEERNATLAYVAEVHELCAIAGRGDLAAGFVAKATPVAQIRRALLEARAAEDEASAIRSQVRPASTEPREPAIDTQAIYAARNQHCR